MFLNFNPNNINQKCENYSWFCSEIGCELFRALEAAGKAALWWIFSLDNRTLNKINIAAAYSLPTSEAIGNELDFEQKINNL